MKEIHLVTGGAGFVGQRIVSRLVEQGHQVRSIDPRRTDQLPDGVEQIQGDICDRGTVRKALKGVTCLHHNAAVVSVIRSSAGYDRVNRVGTGIVAEEARDAGVEQAVLVSTSAIFDHEAKPPFDESTPLVPMESYGESKLAGERLIRDVCAKADIPLAVIRPRTIVGLRRSGIFSLFFSWMQDDVPIPLIGGGRGLFQLLHIDDLMDFYMLALERRLNGNFNVGCERYGTLGGDVDATAEKVGSKSRTMSIPVRPSIALLSLLDLLNLSPLTKFHYATLHLPFHFDIQPLLDLGWRPRYSNVEMLTEAYLDHKSRKFDEAGLSVHERPVKEKTLAVVKWFLKTFKSA